MKRLLIVFLIAFLAIGLVACGGPPGDKNDKSDGNWGDGADEAAAEKMIEDMSGGEVDVDIDDGGDSITISSEEGDLVIEGDEDGMPWPSDKLPSNVPELKGVKVITTMDAGAGISIMFEGCDNGEGEAYIRALTAAGWNITMEMESEGLHTIMCDNGKNEFLHFSWIEEEEGAGSITFGNAE